MINSKEDLNFFLAADRFALGKKGKPRLYGDEVWKYQIALRKCEYYKNKNGIGRILYSLFKVIKKRLGYKLGFDIREGVFDAGWRINHFGNIVINGNCSIGRWCDIHQGVNIGDSNPVKRIKTEKYAPVIGDNVWIGPGAKIFGNITIGSQVQIGANSVVGKSFGEDVTIAGVPAKIISDTGTSSVDVAASLNRTKIFFDNHPEYKKYDK